MLTLFFPAAILQFFRVFIQSNLNSVRLTSLHMTVGTVVTAAGAGARKTSMAARATVASTPSLISTTDHLLNAVGAGATSSNRS